MTASTTAETTIGELYLEESRTMFYEFDFGDGWEHHIELREIREGSLIRSKGMV